MYASSLVFIAGVEDKSCFYLQKSEISNGTLISRIIPWIIATGTMLFPEYRLMTGRQTSMELIPATDTGANLPKKEAYSGAPNKANISRMILANNAIAPSCEAISIPADASFSCTISKEDKE